MITKKVDMKNASKSSFSRLVDYISDSQAKENRVAEISITNCNSNSVEWAKIEIEATQKLNTRAVSDKTYHLLISFRPGEQPSLETLKAIESEICKSIGYEEHQRISVIHNDTDDLHIHIAINKIHPEKLTLHEPYNDYYTRDQMCVYLEEKYNLEKDNHQSKKSKGQSNANDMERIAGIESLITYIKRECDFELVSTWQELHKNLNEKGLDIKLKGNGLIIEDIKTGLTTKASSIGYSKSKLETQLGIFTPNKEPIKAVKNYRRNPVSYLDSRAIYSKYLSEKKNNRDNNSKIYKELRAKRDRLIEEAKKRAKLKREVLKLTKSNPFKKNLYSSINATLLKDIERAKGNYQQEILAAKIIKNISWLDWLKKEAQQTGDKNVLALLRNRTESDNTTHHSNSFSSKYNADEKIVPGARIDTVTKKGNVVYRVANSTIIDDGKKLTVSNGVTSNGLEAAILMAQYRYGNKLALSGTDDFKRKVIELVVKKGIKVTFNDPIIEKYRQNLETQNDRQQRHRSGTTVNRFTRERSGERNTSTARTRTRETKFKRTALSGTINIRRNTGIPITGRSNTVRSLSELSMDSITQRTEVLLSRNAGNDLEERGTRDTSSMRRPVSGTRIFGGIISDDAILAAKKYIEERNSKSNKIFDIKKHIHYNELNLGGTSKTVSYSGMRYINNNALALLKTGDDIIVVIPVSKAIETKLRKCAIGDSITITKGGIKVTSTKKVKR